ncbi:DUF2164 domain-containing protein [Neptuniibacter sp. QD48_11]|uniref:DUF2164 domain-containing protein n=1 Tax=unclassified Neptuniibacter TaxID=2630693 RepID=UPI0039F451CE
MKDIKLSQDQTDRMVSKIKRYFSDELDQDIGSFEAEFLIEFFAKEIGPHFYNQALADANRVFVEKVEDASYLVQELEKPTL